MGRVTPQQILIAVILFFSLSVTYVVWEVINTPFLNIQFKASESTPNILLVTSAPDYPELESKAIVAIGQATEKPSPVGQWLIQREMTFTTYTGFRDFLTQQTLVSTLLKKPEIVLIDSDQVRHKIQVHSKRPAASLPFSFWFCIVQSAVALLFTAGIAAYQRQSLPAKLLLANGFGFLLIMLTVAIYRTRELAIDGEYFRTLLIMNSSGLSLFSFTLVWLLMRYPTPIGSTAMIAAIGGIHFFAAANHYFHWFELPGSATETPKLIVFSIGLSVIIAQWYASRANAINRSIFSWLLFSMMLAIIAYLGLYVVPALLFNSTLVPSWLVGFGVLAIYLGFALGMFQVKLFAVEKIWFDLWIWLAGGVFLVIGDLALMSLLSLDQWDATAISLFIVGWIYFPIRQKLWKKLYPQPQDRVSQLLPSLVEELAGCHQNRDYSQLIVNKLQQAFNPESIQIYPLTGDVDKYSESILKLPWQELGIYLQLDGKERGRQLFAPGDIALAESLISLANKSRTAEVEKQQSAQLERDRIARDLHDDVSAPLLMLVHKAHSDNLQNLAQKALSSVRDAIYALDNKNSVYLEDLLWDTKIECLERVEPLDIELDWLITGECPHMQLTPRFGLNFTRIIREAISNTLKHSKADHLDIALAFRAEELTLQISNNGIAKDFNQDQLILGKGINNMKKRTEELSGEFHYSINQNQRLFSLNILIPLALNSLVDEAESSPLLDPK